MEGDKPIYYQHLKNLIEKIDFILRADRDPNFPTYDEKGYPTISIKTRAGLVKEFEEKFISIGTPEEQEYYKKRYQEITEIYIKTKKEWDLKHRTEKTLEVGDSYGLGHHDIDRKYWNSLLELCRHIVDRYNYYARTEYAVPLSLLPSFRIDYEYEQEEEGNMA